MPSENAVLRLLSKILWSVRQRGPLDTLRVIGERFGRRGAKPLPPHPFDLEHGTDTSGLIGSRDLRTGHAHDIHSTAYFGTPPSRLRHAVERWQSEAGRIGGTKRSDVALSSVTYVDLGCGKGRTLLVASELGFWQVVGVELNPGLADVARANVNLWRHTHPNAAPATVITGDVTEMPLPGGPLLVFLYNPFGAPVLRRLLQHLVATRPEGTPVLDLIYLYPEQAAVFAEFPQFEQLWSGNLSLDPGEPLDGVSNFEDPCHLYRLRTSTGVPYRD